MLYQPHDYQQYATRFIVEHPVAAVLLQMGLGKSVITLTAIAAVSYTHLNRSPNCSRPRLSRSSLCSYCGSSWRKAP